MSETFSLYWENLASVLKTVLPSLITSLVVLIVGYLLGRLVQKLVKRIILHLNEKIKVRLPNKNVHVDFKGSASFISAAFFWIILSVAVLACIHILKFDLLNDLLGSAVLFLPNIIAAVIIIVSGLILGRLLSDLLQLAYSRAGVVNRGFINLAVRNFVLLIAIIIASDQLGIRIDFLTNIIEIIVAMLLFGAAVAFGLGAKTSVSNILGSYYIRKDHQIGTRVRFEGKTGTIVKISGHSIHLDTDEGKIIIPAKQFSEKEVTIIREDV